MSPTWLNWIAHWYLLAPLLNSNTLELLPWNFHFTLPMFLIIMIWVSIKVRFSHCISPRSRAQKRDSPDLVPVGKWLRQAPACLHSGTPICGRSTHRHERPGVATLHLCQESSRKLLSSNTEFSASNDNLVSDCAIFDAWNPPTLQITNFVD